MSERERRTERKRAGCAHSRAPNTRFYTQDAEDNIGVDSDEFAEEFEDEEDAAAAAAPKPKTPLRHTSGLGFNFPLLSPRGRLRVLVCCVVCEGCTGACVRVSGSRRRESGPGAVCLLTRCSVFVGPSVMRVLSASLSLSFSLSLSLSPFLSLSLGGARDL